MANYTASQRKVLYSAAQVFEAMGRANPTFCYDQSLFLDLKCSDGVTVTSVRQDCSGLMAAIIRHMGYSVVDETSWRGLTSNTSIKEPDGSFSENWIFKDFDSSDRQPGDILVKPGHTDMYIFESDGYRGYNAGSGTTSSGPVISIGTGMEYSYNLAVYYQKNNTPEGGGSTVGGYTISDSDAQTVIRYIGPGLDNTYDTDKDIFDIQPSYQATYLGTSVISNSGGVIINAGYAQMDEASPLEGSLNWVSNYAGKIALGFYVYNYMNPGADYSLLVSRYKGVLQPIKDSGIASKNIQLGFWLDQEYNEGTSDAPWGTPTQNFERYKAFKEAVESLGFSDCVIGIYSGLSAFQSNFNKADLADTPLWLAWWTDSIDTVKSTIASEGWNKVYIWQSGAEDKGYGDIDCNRLIQPIPIAGGDTPEPEPEPTVTYVLVPAKKIIFNPEPGLVELNTMLSVSTDAENAKIFVTTDNTVPDPTKSYQNWTGRSVQLRGNYHLRAVAIDKDGNIIAKGAATYTIPWIRPSNEPIDAIVYRIREHQEKSLQPYLMYHPESDIPSIERYNEVKNSDE